MLQTGEILPLEEVKAKAAAAALEPLPEVVHSLIGRRSRGYAGGPVRVGDRDCVMGFFGRRLRGYKAAARVESWRTRAEALRATDPDTYEQILAQAGDDPEAAAAARRDPDAYVALFLSFASDERS
jgi:hypothetical protein